MCLWFQSSYCISCGSKNWGEHKVFSIPLQCLFLVIRTFDRHRHRLYKHNDLSPEHFLDSIYRYDNWANWYHSEYYSVCPVGIFPAAAVQEISSHEDGCIDWLSVFFGCWNCPDVWLGFFRHQWLDDKYRWSLYWIFSLLSAVKNLACQSEKATLIQPCQCCGWSTSLCYLHICHYGHGSDLVCPWCAECSINCIGNNRSQI